MVGDRSAQINRLLVNAKTLLAAFNERGRAIDALLGNISAFSVQVKGLINDNPNLNSVLEQLHAISDVLVTRKDDLAQSLKYVGQFAASLGETVSSGPYFKIVLSNLLPYWILQPWVDAAFKKRGIDPEDFWRSAGLPAFKFPTRTHPVPQWRAAAGAAGAGGHPGSPRTGSGTGLGVLIRAGAGIGTAAVEPVAVRGRRPEPGAVRAKGISRRRPTCSLAAEPGRAAPDTGDPDRWAAGAGATRRSGHAGADTGDRLGHAPSRFGPLPGPCSGESRRGTTARAPRPAVRCRGGIRRSRGRERSERLGSPQGGPGAIGTGVPGASGCAPSGRPAIGIPGVGGRPSGFGGDDATSGKRGIPVAPERPLVLVVTRARHRVARSRTIPAAACRSTASRATAGPGCSGVPSSSVGAGGGAPLVNRCRWGPGTERRQTGVAPELLGIDAALLEGGVDERLQDLVRQQVDRMTLKYGPEATASPSDAANWPTYVRLDQVVLALHQDVADRVQLLEHVVQVRVVVDEALDLRRRTRRRCSSASIACPRR